MCNFSKLLIFTCNYVAIDGDDMMIKQKQKEAIHKTFSQTKKWMLVTKKLNEQTCWF